MDTQHGIFSGKLRELEQQYGWMLEHLRRYQVQDHSEVRQELAALWQEYLEKERLLQKSVAESHSQAVSKLSEAQLEYDARVGHILRGSLSESISGEINELTDRTEAASLYGEYAMDFAAQAMRHAQLAALWAIDLQMTCEECAEHSNNREENPRE